MEKQTSRKYAALAVDQDSREMAGRLAGLMSQKMGVPVTMKDALKMSLRESLRRLDLSQKRRAAATEARP